MKYLLPPANEVCKGYVFTRVCRSVHSGGSTWVGTPLTRYTSHKDQVQPPWTRYTPLRPGTPPRDHVHPLGPGPPPGPGTPPGAVHAGRYGQQVGGMHPTGMHSCYLWIYLERVWSNRSITITQTPAPYKSLLRDPSLFNFNDNVQKETGIVGVENYRNQTSKH